MLQLLVQQYRKRIFCREVPDQVLDIGSSMQFSGETSVILNCGIICDSPSEDSHEDCSRRLQTAIPQTKTVPFDPEVRSRIY